MRELTASRRDEVRSMLADLRMPGALEAIDDVLAPADGGHVTASEAIHALLDAQITLRNNRRLQAAMRSSRLPAIKTLEQAQAAGTLLRRLAVLTHPALLVVDEIGYLPVTRTGAVLFFQLISRRYEHGSTVLTSNKGFEEWGEVLGDEVMAAALIDRLPSLPPGQHPRQQLPHAPPRRAATGSGASGLQSRQQEPRGADRLEGSSPSPRVQFSPAKSVQFSTGVDKR
ncbi:MAG: ATP-binding protein [Thermoanaerobaculia bacterium]